MPGSDWRGEGRPLQTKSGDTDKDYHPGRPGVTGVSLMQEKIVTLLIFQRRRELHRGGAV